MAHLYGNITALLKPEYAVQGYRLTEDEDFVYLWKPGNTVPVVFSSHGVTMESIEAKIKAGGAT